MEKINQMITFLQVIIPLGGAARIVYCLAVMSMDGEEQSSYKKRIRNILVFIVLAECASGFLRMAAHYYGG